MADKESLRDILDSPRREGSFFWDKIVPYIGYVIEENEREAREQWEHKRKQVERSVKEQKRKIQQQLQEAKENYNFKMLTSNHQSSLIAADTAYKLLQFARTTLDGIGKMIVLTKEKRAVLENNFKKQIEDYSAREKIKEELKDIADLRKKLFLDKDKVKEQRDNLYSDVRSLNAKTTELKCLIRDHCGDEGVEWYSRLEKRQRLNQSTDNHPINDSSNAMVKYKPTFIVLDNNRIRLSNIKDYGIKKGYKLVAQRKTIGDIADDIVLDGIERGVRGVFNIFKDPPTYTDGLEHMWETKTYIKPKMKKVYYRYLFVTTSGLDFKFVEDECDFDIDEEFKKLDLLMNLEGIESTRSDGAIMNELSTNATPEQLYEMAWKYYLGEGVAPDAAKALRLCKLAVDRGHTLAAAFLSNFYAFAVVVKKDQQEEARLLKIAMGGASYTDESFMAEELFMVYAGFVAKRRFKTTTEALSGLQKEAEAGNSGAAFILALGYYHCIGITQDYNKVVKWMRKAADQSHTKAQRGLGALYYYGIGLSQNYDEAVKWIREAAYKGDIKAMYALGCCYNLGQGVFQDHNSAMYWFRLAAEHGDEAAQKAIYKFDE